MAGALGVLDEAGVTAVPLLWTIALPSGPVRHAAFEALADEIAQGLQQQMPVDGLFLELHGAMATTEDEDAELSLIHI